MGDTIPIIRISKKIGIVSPIIEYSLFAINLLSVKM